MTQDELGELLGMAGATVSRMETGALGIDADSVPKLAAALGVPPSDFYEGGKVDHDAKSRVIWPRVERAAQRAAELAAENVRSAIREEVQRAVGEALRERLPEASIRGRTLEEGNPRLADQFLQWMGRGQWNELSEEEQRQFWGYVDALREAREREEGL